MAKEEVCKEEVRREMVESMLAHFEFAPLKDFKILFGGYSGTSIAVTGSDDTKAVLKVCHGYTMEDVDAQVAICVHARSNGFDGICTALPRRGLPSKFTVSREDGAVCCLLSWVDGIAADKVVSAGRVPATDVLSAVGAGLARLHSVPVSDAAATELRAIEAGGGCDLRKHVGGEYEAEIMSSEEVKGHDFLPFYERQLACLRTALAEPGLPRGLLHADPFLDNILVDATNGTLEGFVDLEDVCVGPLLFDVACCACASCFREDGALDGRRLRALLTAYSEIRPLEPAERRRFVDFMKLTMLCNCSWRFKNFNIDHREIESCRDAHRELQGRIESLEDDTVAALTQQMLNGLPREPTVRATSGTLAAVASRAMRLAQSADGGTRVALAVAVAVPAAIWALRWASRRQ